MKTDDIKKMIEMFYNGDTTIEEEQFLLHYFMKEDVAEELLIEKEYFLHVATLKPLEIPLTFKSKVDILFEDLENTEKKEDDRKKIWLAVGGAAAIVAILFFVGQNWYKSEIIDNRYTLVDTIQSGSRIVAQPIDSAQIDTIEKVIESDFDTQTIISDKGQQIPEKTKVQDEKITYEDYKNMMKALRMVSDNIDKGLNQLNVISESMEQTTEVLNRKQN